MEPERKSLQIWAGDYLGRLWDLPEVSLQPMRRPLSDYWAGAPEWLKLRARRPLTPAEQVVWAAIRDGAELGTDAIAKVPVWIPDWKVGYVLDFLLPEYGINVQIDAWDPALLEDEDPDWDFEAEPDHPENHNRSSDLREAEGIEAVHYWDETVHELGGDGVAAEIRKELGIGRPPWLTRMPGSKPSRIPPP